MNYWRAEIWSAHFLIDLKCKALSYFCSLSLFMNLANLFPRKFNKVISPVKFSFILTIFAFGERDNNNGILPIIRNHCNTQKHYILNKSATWKSSSVLFRGFFLKTPFNSDCDRMEYRKTGTEVIVLKAQYSNPPCFSAVLGLADILPT